MVDDTRLRLIEAAGPIFAEQGYRATTVREICAQAGVNVALVNYHFGDKENLYVEAVRCASHACLQRVPPPVWPPGVSPRQKLFDFVVMFLSRVVIQHEPAWHGQLIMREMHVPTRACAEFVEAHVRPTSALLMEILDELLPAGASQRQRRMIGFSVVGQILHYWSARPVLQLLVGDAEMASYDVATLGRHITDFSLAAIDRLAADGQFDVASSAASAKRKKGRAPAGRAAGGKPSPTKSSKVSR